MPAQQMIPDKGSKATKIVASLPFNPSSQQLVSNKNDFDEDPYIQVTLSKKNKARLDGKTKSSNGSTGLITRRQWLTVFILFFVNLINYMDRLTIAGILSKIQNDFQISDAAGGALQTAFVVSYMIFAPIFGYMGDRRSRKLIMAFGVFIWTIFTIIGSFMQSFSWFLICRALVGIGEASYSTIAPTIISDMFVKDVRSKMLAFFYFAIPVGSGLGYVIGAETTNLAGGDWRWGLRVTPVLGLVAVFLILFCMTEPPRGESEGHKNMEATSYCEDLTSLAMNKSFVLSTLAFTCVAFCTGALSWWGPKFLEAAVVSSFDDVEGSKHGSVANISLIFGVVTMMSGIVGVPLGSILSTKLKQKYPRADPIICAVGLMVSAVFLGIGMVTCQWNLHLTFFLLFLGEVALNLNWSIVADILLYTVIPTRRSTAEALQILISHAFGDAGSPYLIGVVSDLLKTDFKSNISEICNADSQKSIPKLEGLESYSQETTTCDFKVDFYSMQYSLFINNIVEIVGGLFFFITAIYILKDKKNCDRYVSEHSYDRKKSELEDMLGAQVYHVESESISTEDDDNEAPILQLIQPSSNDSLNQV